VDLKAQNVGDLAKYLEGIHEDFDASGIYNILPRATRLFTLGEGLAKRMENYRDQQMVDVFGEIKVPLRKDERGWILPSPRTLGNTTDESILALVHSQNRLTVQIAVPIAVWKNHDLTGMQVRVRLHDDEVPARIVKMDLQPRLSGQLIVTLD
jgi:hypothetical protein